MTFKEKDKKFTTFWKSPDFLFVMIGLINIVMMLVTYWWASSWVYDPREAVIFVAIEAVLILAIGNVFVESSKEAISANALKSQFIDIVAHQIRTPLSAIKWSLELIKQENKENFSDKQRKYFDQIGKANEEIIDLANNFIGLVDLESNVEFKKDKINLTDLIEQRINNILFLAEIDGTKIEFKNESGLNYIKGDETKIAVIVDNLLDNAIKYGQAGRAIEVNLSKKNDCLIIRVTNFGMGIAQDEKKSIFEKFYRSRMARKKSVQGNGLGLYISKVLAQKMGGDLFFESIPEVKTSFFLKLPIEDK